MSDSEAQPVSHELRFHFLLSMEMKNSLYIYGGYQDLKGSTSELWAFHFGKLQIDWIHLRIFLSIVTLM